MSEQAPNTQSEAQFVLQRIYVKDMSFESPRAPDSFLQQWKPKINMDLNTSNRGLGEDNYEVVLAITITATNEADEVVYLVEVQQAGVFLVRGLEDEALKAAFLPSCWRRSTLTPSTHRPEPSPKQKSARCSSSAYRYSTGRIKSC
jgi:protein-export chaperone SecB